MSSSSSTVPGYNITPSGWLNRTRKRVRESHVGSGWEDKGLINEQAKPCKTTSYEPRGTLILYCYQYNIDLKRKKKSYLEQHPGSSERGRKQKTEDTSRNKPLVVHLTHDIFCLLILWLNFTIGYVQDLTKLSGS